MTGGTRGALRYACATVALPTLTPAEAVGELVAAGYCGVEWKVGPAPQRRSSTAARFLRDNLCTLEVSVAAAEQARELCAAAGLEVVGLAPYLAVGDLPGLRAVLDMASASGAPQIRLQAGRPADAGGTYASLFADMRHFLAAAEPLARDAGVRLDVEMHQNTIVPSASLVERLVAPFDPEVVGVIYDVGNLVFEGYEEHALALELLGPHLHHVHLKNAAAARSGGTGGGWAPVWAALDDGLVDVPVVLTRLLEAGYTGWVSLEDFSTVRGPVETLHHNASVLRAIEHSGWTAPPAQRERGLS